MTTIYLVRHAVTSHTGHKLTGWMEGVHLTEEGREQAERTAALLAEVPFKAVYSSPIDRTIETARIVALPHKLDVKINDQIGEVRYGKWTNRSLKALVRTKMWATLQRWPSSVRFPEGETLREVQARAVEGIEQLREMHPRDPICVVSHGDTIKLIVAHYLGVHIDLFQRIFIGPASVSVLNVSPYGPQILSLNAMPVPRPGLV
ncbi:MAG TPA: MSMEG_4193 family putative phosphomutase [Actinomycetota bacterium]|nr:MSMEG_4193 family putative phosphomutase [Actinomycetota bacterium]